jgi:hypothetical protein
MSAGREAPVVPTDAEDLFRIDPPADDPGPKEGGPGGAAPEATDAVAAGRSDDLLPAGFSLDSRCRPRIDDASIRPPAPADADWRSPAVRPWT